MFGPGRLERFRFKPRSQKAQTVKPQNATAKGVPSAGAEKKSKGRAA